MKTNSFMNKLKYRFDNLMARGSIAMILGLTIISAIIIFTVSIIIWAFNYYPEQNDFVKLLWMSMMRALDAGTVAGDEGRWEFLISMLGVTIGGIFFMSALIGVLTTGLDNKLQELRKGRSKVIEKNHTIILGFNEQVYTIISELVLANENQKKSCIVILGPADKVEMEESIRDKVGKTGKTRVVCRQGSPIDINDLGIVNVNMSKAIIILSPEEDPEPDSSVIKTILAITNHPNRRKRPFNIVAEIRDPKNYEITKVVGKDEVEVVLVGDLISRIIAQTCRQPGLSFVYTELLDFGGVEIYFKEEPSLRGKSFHDILFHYEDSAVIGIVDKNGVPKVNPPMDYKLGDYEKLIAISEDDDTIILSGKSDYGIKNDTIVKETATVQPPEKTLILGWNWRVSSIIRELDNYVPHGSSLTIVANSSDGREIIKKECMDAVKNTKINYVMEDTTSRKVLENLVDEDFHHVIVVCYDHLPVQQTDAITLITLLHLRDIAQKTGKEFSIVSEMLDIKNRNLAEITRVNDFIISDKLISLLLSQISENKYLNPVFHNLFDPEGSEIYLKPAANYVKPGIEVNFYTVLESATQRNEIPIGYKIAELTDNPEKAYGIVVDPLKSTAIVFKEEDKIIVIAQD
ncbi:MAG: hypothetical protein JW969_04705 [Spirochaetales bacterium]|nr:hypothetical protein [Spirochaetales bacterium]